MVDVVGPVLSAIFAVLLERMAVREVVDFFRKNDLDLSLLEKMKTWLMSVNSVLAYAEEKEAVDPFVKKWVDKLREVVYDAEDLVDKITFQTLQDESQLDKMLGFVSSLNPFSTGVNAKIEKIIEALELVAQQKDFLGLEEESVRKELLPYSKPTSSLVNASHIHGRDNDVKIITDFLLSANASDEQGASVVAIVGVAGIGKTTLAQLVYNQEEVKAHFPLRVWVHVSYGLDYYGITSKIYEAVTVNPCSTTDFNLLQVKLKEITEGIRFLMILDDLDGFFDWDIIKKPFIASSGSKIIVTSRTFSTASILGASLTHSLSYLEYEDCWKLFVDHAFKNRNLSACSTLQKIGQRIVRKCCGLPVAAKMLGSLLHSLPATEEWDRVLTRDIKFTESV
ncbi:putative disease resistance RPP13-like protein 1 [Abrus precatorius]|uniref:Disease resistance RPP13-like protein 1 n=1 Tax=Abrus precatorius TaxID=3816 RepID=A0A8B8LKG4_ABRPR|nr:putative disease resistance RPP13-like protein 1 [Abrus precatorius]